jgi:hypothetical protein
MDGHAAIASLLATVPEAAAPCGELRAKYRRDPSIKKKAEQSAVERTLSRARHLSVHYAHGAELARILRDARDVEPRIWRDTETKTQRYLWPQDVTERALWPDPKQRQIEIEFTRDLAQAFSTLLMAVLPAYRDRMGIEPGDITILGPGT